MSTGYCYVAETPTLYKFGYSENPRLRLASLRDCDGDLVRLKGYVAGSRIQEACLHELLNRFRLHGEWYRKTPETAAVAALFPARTGRPPRVSPSEDKAEAKRLLLLCLKPGETFISQVDRIAEELGLHERRVRAIRNGEARRIHLHEIESLRRMAQRARDFAAEVGA